MRKNILWTQSMCEHTKNIILKPHGNLFQGQVVLLNSHTAMSLSQDETPAKFRQNKPSYFESCYTISSYSIVIFYMLYILHIGLNSNVFHFSSIQIELSNKQTTVQPLLAYLPCLSLLKSLYASIVLLQLCIHHLTVTTIRSWFSKYTMTSNSCLLLMLSVLLERELDRRRHFL